MLRRTMRGGNFSSMGTGWGLCRVPNVTSRSQGLQGMGGGMGDWWDLAGSLISTGGSLGTQYLANQAPQAPAPTIIYQQQPAAAAPAASSSNTALYIGLGVVAVGGLVWYLSTRKGK